MNTSESTATVESPLTSTSDAAPSVPSTADGLATVGNEVDAMFGYRAPAPARDDPDDDADGAPPSPSSESTTSTTDQPAAGAPPADAGQPTTEGTAAPAAPAPTDDPLKDATPFTYTVNGQERSDDRIKVVKDLGAFINPEDIPHIAQRLSERDHLYERQQEQYRDLQALERLTEWKTKDAQGNDVTLTGREAIEAQRIQWGNVVAEVAAYREIFKDPMRLASYLMVSQDGQSYELNPDAVRTLATQVENAQLKMGHAVRQWAAQLPRIATPKQETPAPVDPAALAPSAVDHAIRSAAIAGLTDADRQWAASVAPRYIRTATPQDVQQNPALVAGSPVLDPEFVDLLKDRAALRAESAKQVGAAASAATANAPKLAAAMLARPARPQAPARPAPQPSGDDELSPEEQAYLRFEQAGAAALRARAV